jgi:plastocyanin
MRKKMAWMVASLLVAAGGGLAACGGDDDTTGPPGGGGNPVPAAIAAVSGGGQTGRTLEALPNPLVVRVTDSGGATVSGATVTWTIAQGGGSLSGASSTTNSQGQASIEFTPGALIETSRIDATVNGVATAASFSVETSILVIEMDRTAFVAPNGTDEVTIPLGATVEFVNRDAMQHTATGSSMPPGTPMLNSGLMNQGDRYQYTPTVAGTWVYFCQVHPVLMAGATITVE